MSDKKIKKIIKTAVEKEMANNDCPPVTDEEMKSSEQPLPPDEIWEKLKEKTKKEKM